MALDVERFTLEVGISPDVAVHLKYDGWHVVAVTLRGNLVRDESIPTGIGFNVDEVGRIKLVKPRRL